MNTQCRVSIGMLTCFAACVPGIAQDTHEITKYTAHDAARDDNFGWSVGMSGTMLVVGAPGNGVWGAESGSLYVFDTSTGRQRFRFTVDDPASYDNFGWSVAISETTVIAGAPHKDDAGDASGAAYLVDAVSGEQLFKLTASDAAPLNQFGGSVGVTGTTAVIGARGDGDAGPFTGSAYLFSTVTGQQQYKLTASDARRYDLFGNAVAISGSMAVVGAPGGRNFSCCGETGAAYVFDAETGEQLRKFTASDGAHQDDFGCSVAISGTIAIVGARYDDDAGEDSGSAYLFDVVTGEQLFKLTASEGAAGDNFGVSVSIAGSVAVVGAWLHDRPGESSGAAYLFDVTTGQQLAKLVSSGAIDRGAVGFSVGISGSTVVVSDFFDDSIAESAGAALLFSACGVDYEMPIGTLDANDLQEYLDRFGRQDPSADLAEPFGVWNFFDLGEFLTQFNQGCP